MYPSYTAATFARKYDLAAKHQINFEGAVTWAFEFEDQPWFEGFRDLATNGVDKPVMGVFRMFGMMGDQRIRLQSDCATIGWIGITATRTRSGNRSARRRRLPPTSTQSWSGRASSSCSPHRNG